MIHYWVNARDSFTLRWYLERRGRPIAGHFQAHHYEDLGGDIAVGGSAHILAALDQLTDTGRALMAELWDRLGEASPTWARLNDPRRVMLREPFLRAMADAGLNGFRVYRPTESLAQARFPVFVRQANRHKGPLTGLLDSPGAVAHAILLLRRWGYRLADLLVVEYQHTADTTGRIRKYAAYRIGPVILRAHLMISHHWAVKADSNETSFENVIEGTEYIRSNLHDEWLHQVFSLARIEYGRIDYGVTGGRPQAWEINMNPTIGRPPGRPPEPASPQIESIREECRADVHRKLHDAFLGLDPGASDGNSRVRLPPTLLRAARREWVLARQRTHLIDFLARAGKWPLIGWPVSAVYGRLSHRY